RILVPILGKSDDRHGHVRSHERTTTPCVLVTCALALACKRPDPGPDLQVVGETLRLRAGDSVPRNTPWFDGTRVSLVAARGEVLGIQILHRGGGPVSLQIQGATVQGYDVAREVVTRPSTSMYGGSRGAGAYPDGLTPAAVPSSDPAFFEITAQASGAGELVVGERHIPVALDVRA